MRRILSVLLENESGALSRVVGLFSQRGYNIESLTVAPTDDPTLSRMTIQTVGDEKVLEQIEKQLHKLVDVLRVSELVQGAHVEREIMLVKLQASGYGREEVKRCADISAARSLTLPLRCTPFNWPAPAISWMRS
jgi:acetolactate synthase I/III small subunit